ncbi:MAG: hypothetical protein ABSE73_01880 [Planctomycetota bacterium]
MPDPVLRELWAIKDKLAEECHHDLRQLFERLKSMEKSTSQPAVNRVAQAKEMAKRGAFRRVLDRVPRRPPLPGDEIED